MTNKIKYENQFDDAIENEPNIDNTISLSYEPNGDPLRVVTVDLRGDKNIGQI